MSNFKKIKTILASGGLLSIFVMNSMATAIAADKAAFVYVAHKSDYGWSYSHDIGRVKSEKALQGKFKTSFIENITDNAGSERTFRQLAQQGNKVIFATTFGYMNSIEKVAKQFPNTIFMHANGYKTAKNVGVYDIRTYEGSYLQGVLAGQKTKSNILGVVAPFPIPEVIRDINAYTLGAQSVNPKIKTKVVWINTWFDPGKEREAAFALMSQNADVLSQVTNSPAVVQAAQEKGKYAFGWNSDMGKYAPKGHLAATILDWEKIYTPVLKQVHNKTWKPTSTWYGIKEGAIDLQAFGPMVTDIEKRNVTAVRDKIKNGQYVVFSGPLYLQNGTLKLEKGKHLSNEELMGMNYFVKGVDANFPK